MTLPTLEEITEAAEGVAEAERSGKWFEDAPGEPTVAELESSALRLFTPPPEPEHTPRERRATRRKKTMLERVFNKDLSSDSHRGDFSRPLAKQPTCAADLTPTQIFRLFDERINFGHPSDRCYSLYRFEPTADDREQIEWVCWLNVREWMTSLRMCVYADLPETEWRQAESVPIAEDNLTDFLAAYRAKFAAKDPVRARFYAMSETPGLTTRSPEYIAAREAVRVLEREERRAALTRLGMTPAFIDKELAFADRLTERNRRGSCGGMEA